MPYSDRLVTTILRSSLVLFLLMIAFSCNQKTKTEIVWPEIARENKPWIRWWWEGSAVTKEGITAELEDIKNAGLGGVEITPIYGVYGEEENFIEYLSPQWMEMLQHTLAEAERLDLGVDMATGTGWPFGGPWVSQEDACQNMNYKVYKLKEGESVSEPIQFHQEPFVRSVGMQIYEMHGIYKVEGQENKGTAKEPLLRANRKPIEIKDLSEPISSNKNLQALALDQVRFDKQLTAITVMAYSDGGETIDLTDKVDENRKLNWKAPAGQWRVFAVFPGWHGKMVERAAPGGEGDVIDHFSKTALNNYLKKFDDSFGSNKLTSLRGFFNDSYEVDDARGAADWTPKLFDEFKSRRGYDLREHLPAFFALDEEEKNERVLCDYRETISELVHDNFTAVWKQWANGKGKIVRNQAHGSPANILDLYAEVDIPEMEGTEELRIKMASSASNVTGKQLTSSESATWLNEHFLSNLADMKESLDRFMISGVNHMFYHGTNYSPKDAPWPGWLFYAAIHANSRNPMWTDFAKLNEYIARCQSFLQRSKPANDILLYFPIYDRFSTPGQEMIEHFDGVDRQFEGTAFKESAEEMLAKGFSFDYISDKQIKNLKVEGEKISSSPNSSYRTVLVPSSKYIPLETFKALMKLAKDGATILIYKNFPTTISGFQNIEASKKEYADLLSQVSFAASGSGLDEAVVGSGRFLRSDDLTQLMEAANVKRESLVDDGLKFIRKKNDDGVFYLITNWSDHKIDDWVALTTKTSSIVLFDPMFGEMGSAKTQSTDGVLSVHLQLERGESVIVQTYDAQVDIPSFPYKEPSGDPITISGKWNLTFTYGGPTLPPSLETDSLGSWTNLPDEELKRFSGTGSYKISFNKPGDNAKAYTLDLGTVKESARVSLNGNFLATLIGPTYKIDIDASFLKDVNEITIDVSNLMANRIADMDKREVFWKKFYNVNFPARLAENRKNGLFDASGWSPRDSGLLGPVRLIPIE